MSMAMWLDGTSSLIYSQLNPPIPAANVRDNLPVQFQGSLCGIIGSPSINTILSTGLNVDNIDTNSLTSDQAFFIGTSYSQIIPASGNKKNYNQSNKNIGIQLRNKTQTRIFDAPRSANRGE